MSNIGGSSRSIGAVVERVSAAALLGGAASELSGESLLKVRLLALFLGPLMMN